MPRPGHALLLVAGIAGLVLPTIVGAQTPSDETPQLTSRLILGFRPVSVSADPGLRADRPEHADLLAGLPGTRVFVATLEGPPLLRLGNLDGSELTSGGEDAPARRSIAYDLWLSRTSTSWVLEARRSEDGDASPDSEVLGLIPLSYEGSARTVPTLSAALSPIDADHGQLQLIWANHHWTADYTYATPPEPSEPDEDESEDEGQADLDVAAGDGVRDFDSDTSAISRGVTLAERHESSITLLDGSTISVLFWQEVGIDHDDFAGVTYAEDGDVLRLTEAAVIRLRTEVPLRFGPVTVPTDNLAPDFPGSYGLWIKRTGNGWRLVFNDEPDAWGTQHRPELDRAEIELRHTQGGLSSRPLGVTLRPIGEERGQLVIHWGAHEWSTEFIVTS